MSEPTMVKALTEHRSWIVGGAIAATGVILKRSVAPQMATPVSTWTAIAGILLATVGLAVIAMGISASVKRANRERFSHSTASPVPISSADADSTATRTVARD